MKAAMSNPTPERELCLARMVIGNNELGEFDYFIHEVEYKDFKQFRLRLNFNGKFKVLFSREITDLEKRIQPLMKELLV